MTAELGPQITDALEEWITRVMKERSGPGIGGVFISDTGRRVKDKTYGITDMFEAINEVAPDAIARMLQAGAAAYIKQDDDHVVKD